MREIKNLLTYESFLEMAKVLQNNWKSIVTTLLCIKVYVDADSPNALVWNVLRRLFDDGGLPFNSIAQETNVSNIIDDGLRRARMKLYTITTESSSSHHLPHKNHPKQKPKDGDKMQQKLRFIIEDEASPSKHHSHKDYNRIEKKSANFTGYEGMIHPRGELNDTVEPNKKYTIQSNFKPKSQQLRAQFQAESLLAVMRNQTKGNAAKDDNSKLAVRAGRYREESNENNLKSSTIRITKMAPAYQLQDDVNDEPERKPEKQVMANDRLNPYAIDQQMQRFMDNYKKEMNITMEVIGRTAEYNNIVLLKITESQQRADKNFRTIFEHKYADEAAEKKIIFIVHGLTVMGMDGLIHNEDMFRTLMSYYTAHLDKFDIFIIPIANPDGFTAIFNSQRGKFWNKNNSPQSSCAGVALDRNFDVEWNTTQGISPCSHMYPGPAPFSEPETRAVRDVLHLYSQKIIAYIHVHASTFSGSIFKGDAVLYPRGYTSVQNDDDKYLDIKGDIEESLKNATFRVISVSVEPLYYWYGKVLGTSVDYASTIYGIPYAMEFAMQVYDFLEKEALLQIWRRVIDVVFKNIEKNAHNHND